MTDRIPSQDRATTGRASAAPGTAEDRTAQERPGGVSRRALLGTAGATGLVLGAAGGGVGYALAPEGSEAPTEALSQLGARRAMFHVKHQPGITTPLQAKGHLLAFDLLAGKGRREAANLLRRWSGTAERLMAGEAVAADGHDTGVALDAGPASLTVTFGFGHSFFSRTGLEKQRPEALAPLPQFSSDHLDAKRGNGDLWAQIGADDALVAFHALRALQKDARGTARVRWQMNGFNRSPGATASPRTARNLMGQLDGTGNPQESDKDFAQRVFVGAGDGPEWMANGSYVVMRRIRMLLDDWEGLGLAEQEKVIGRRKSTGAPLTGGGEHTEPELDATDKDGDLVIPLNAHARITRPDQNGGAAMLRRPFSYHDGIDADGVPDAGLLFLCWQADPLRGFVPVQRKLDRGDALSEYIRHEASGLYAVPGGAGKGEYVGQGLLEG
ncbi:MULTISPECIES: iron uptake transporter deferrochelatase/peroxidase subunit [unclassified Streptomyces]|uniref:iron uptake transporter deferrochelatase/peroxidase subunit n=1 Tax=unclassified Streptomyces TaxID=2593676 RepID=UPI00081D4D59|nr:MULTISPECIES: iron uptake transporter deferrochelatase/peroxidase subunit [unclassified Streptomyces]MYR27335.1 deferrochelatase/peroxidase EfeB [Streptomyces sp. SID4945]SCF22015.1 dye decolorizing peroxidase [Streptomyces sp. LcepLS]